MTGNATTRNHKIVAPNCFHVAVRKKGECEAGSLAEVPQFARSVNADSCRTNSRSFKRAQNFLNPP